MAEWKYYNHAMVSARMPHQVPDLTPLQDGSLWENQEGTPLLARWTSDFDCAEKTEWWYVIKDEPFDINGLKAKRRYEINKGRKNFDVRRLLRPTEYGDELYRVHMEALSAYPAK